MSDPNPEKPMPLWCSLVAIAGCLAMTAMGVGWIVEQQVIGRSGGGPVLQGTGAVIAGIFVIGLAAALIVVTVHQHRRQRDSTDTSHDEDSASADG